MELGALTGCRVTASTCERRRIRVRFDGSSVIMAQPHINGMNSASDGRATSFPTRAAIHCKPRGCVLLDDLVLELVNHAVGW